MRDKKLIIAAMLLPAALIFSTAAFASGNGATEAVSENAPVVSDIEAGTYVGIPIEIPLSSEDSSDDVVLYQVTERPRLGEAEINGNTIKYSPGQRTGKDRFAYTAVDAEGNTAKPASVTVRIEKNKAKFTYSDMEGNPAHYAALKLSADGVITGEKIGGCAFFHPSRNVTRSEFIAMAASAAGLEIEPTDETDFADDSGLSDWAKPYVSAAAANGLISGYRTASGNAEIRGHNPITIGEASVIINKLIAASADGSEYAVFNEGCGSTDWVEAAIGSLERMQVISPAALDIPADTAITRADACMMLYRLRDK